MKKQIEGVLFGSKWLITPFLFGLIIIQILYCAVYLKEIWHLALHFNSTTESAVMLAAVGFVDMTMIACLIYMIISGSYNSFISKDHHEENARISSGLLKVKMATSIIGVSSIHMLQSFVNINNVSWDVVNKQLAIHAGFIIGALAVSVIDYLHEAQHKDEPHSESTDKTTNKDH